MPICPQKKQKKKNKEKPTKQTKNKQTNKANKQTKQKQKRNTSARTGFCEQLVWKRVLITFEPTIEFGWDRNI